MNCGDPCPSCKAGFIQVVNTIIADPHRIRYLGCRQCGFRPDNNSVIVPLKYAPPRVTATGSNRPPSRRGNARKR